MSIKQVRRNSRIKYLYEHCGLTLEEIGKIYDISRARVQAIVTKTHYELNKIDDTIDKNQD